MTVVYSLLGANEAQLESVLPGAIRPLPAAPFSDAAVEVVPGSRGLSRLALAAGTTRFFRIGRAPDIVRNFVDAAGSRTVGS
jgi:hypothetical protein